MKIKKFFICLGLILIITVSGCSLTKGLTKEEKAANETKLLEAIENRMFIVEVDRAIPMSGDSRMLTSPYSLEINGEKVKSYLPYFGRAYSVPYGGGEGLIFDADITDYKSSVEKKGTTVVEFKTKSKEDQPVYCVHISSSGAASIDVTSINRQPISFHGKASPKKE